MALAIVTTLLFGFSIFITSVAPSAVELLLDSAKGLSQSHKSCQHSPASRHCWGDYGLLTNWYNVTPYTGVTREYWLSVENTTVSPDGYERKALTFNGSIPGPGIVADWGDELIIHVTNNLENNGTSVHWHGIRQLNSVEMDGTPGVTQCPIAPGHSFTYRVRATQYGTTWYHSHFTLQYGEGLHGPLVINGPATTDYDEDLGPLMLNDWSHVTLFNLWNRWGFPPFLDNILINGTNAFDCSKSKDINCLGIGKRFEATFVPGRSYRIRLINSGTHAHFRFSIDNHTFQVISSDLVPIVPFTTDNILIGGGQRYDIVVQANAAIGNYWLRAGFQTDCGNNNGALNGLGIIRYTGSDHTDPTTMGAVYPQSCDDDPHSVVPYLNLDVDEAYSEKVLDVGYLNATTFYWTINTTALHINWSDPTVLKILNHELIFPTPYNVFPIEPVNKWVYWIIQDTSGLGKAHPIHLHGHDFFILAQGTGPFDANNTALNHINPTRRDVAGLPGNGFLALAFQTDNPGLWLMHCHVAWHSYQGLALQFVERENEISAIVTGPRELEQTCRDWDEYVRVEAYQQDYADAGL